MQESLIKRLEWDHHMKIYIDMVIVLSSVLFGSYRASSSHEALNSVFKSHHNTPVTGNVSISQSWIVRRGSKGQRYVTFNLNMRHHTKSFLFFLHSVFHRLSATNGKMPKAAVREHLVSRASAAQPLRSPHLFYLSVPPWLFRPN